MNIIWNYFCVQLKRSISYLGNFFLIFCLFLAITVAGIFGIQKALEQRQQVQPITVAVIVPEGDEMTKFFAKFISGMDSVRSICQFQYMNIEEAQEGLQTGQCDAAIELTEGFYEDVDTGVNTPVSVYFAPEPSFEISVFAELLQSAVSIVQITEANVYAATDMGAIYKMNMRRGKMQEFLSYIYLDAAYGRTLCFDRCILSETGELRLEQYYLIVGILFLMLMTGTAYAYFYQKENEALESYLVCKGVKKIWQNLIKIGWMTIFLFLMMSGIYFAISRVVTMVYIDFDYVAMLGILPLAASIAIYFHFLYSIFEEKGILGLMLCNAFMFLLAGGLVPNVYFPVWVQKLGELLPLTYWMEYMRQILFGENYHFSIVPLLMISICLGLIGWIKNAKIQKLVSRAAQGTK